MPTQSLIRVSDCAYAILDRELLLLVTDTTTFPRPILLASAFHTRSAGWRLLRGGAVDIGYAPDAVRALERLLEDVKQRPSLYPIPLYGVVILDDLEVGSLPL